VTPVDVDKGPLHGAWVTRFNVKKNQMTSVSLPSPTRTLLLCVSEYVAKVQITMELEPMVLEPGVRPEYLRPAESPVYSPTSPSSPIGRSSSNSSGLPALSLGEPAAVSAPRGYRSLMDRPAQSKKRKQSGSETYQRKR
jgi:hypothetical protein